MRILCIPAFTDKSYFPAWSGRSQGGTFKELNANPRRYGVFRGPQAYLNRLLRPAIDVPSSRAEHRSSRR